MPDPINIILNIEATKAAETVQQFVDATTQSIERSYTNAVDRANLKIDELNRKQQAHRSVIEENGRAVDILSQKKTGASEQELRHIDAEIAKYRQLSQARNLDIQKIEEQKAKQQEKAVAASNASDQEKLAMRYITDARMIELKALQDAIKAHEASAQASSNGSSQAIEGIHKVVNARKVLEDVLDEDVKKMAELSARQEQSSGTERKAIDQQVASMKKIIATRQDEMLSLDAKRVKLEELLALEHATSEQEEADIRKVTSERLAEIETLRDEARSQNAVTQSVAETSNGVGQLVQQFGGLVGVTSIVSGIAVAFNAVQAQMQAIIDKAADTNEALKGLLHQQGSAQERLDSGFNEYGATTEDQKRKIQGVLFGDSSHDSIPIQYGTNEDQTRSAFSAIAPVLKAHGITPDDPRFAQLVGTASIFNKKGMEDSLIRNMTSDLLGANANATGDDLNTKLTQMVDVAGSPKFATPLGNAIYEHRRQAELGGLNDTDLMKMWSVGRSKGLSPEETGEAVGGLETAGRRFVGKTYDERLELFEKLSGIMDDPSKRMQLEAFKKFNKGKALEKEMSMTSAVSPVVRKWLMGQATTRDVLSDMSSMSPDELNLISTQVGGGRMSQNASAVLSGWTNQTLPQGGITAPLVTPEQHQSALVDQYNNRAALDQPQAAAGEAFGEALPNTVKFMSQHRDLYPTGMDPQGFGQKWVPGMNTLMGNGNRPLTPEMIQRSYAVGMEFMSAARMLNDPRLTPAAKASLRQQMQSLLPYMGLTHGVPQNIQTLLGTDDSARANALSGLGTQDAQMNFLGGFTKQNAPNLPADILSNKALDSSLGGIDAIRGQYIDKPATQGPPAPRPTSQPVSVNYHIRNTNYGYSPDSLGQINSPANNYG